MLAQDTFIDLSLSIEAETRTLKRSVEAFLTVGRAGTRCRLMLAGRQPEHLESPLTCNACASRQPSTKGVYRSLSLYLGLLT